MRKAGEYLRRADEMKANADRALAEGRLDKCGEMLWGVLACHLNALMLLRAGRPATGHREMVEVGRELAAYLGDERLYRAIRHAEKLHANFYHLFMDEEDMRKAYGEVMYAVGVVRRMIERLYRGLLP